MIKEDLSPIYVDGVVKLHGMLHEEYLKAIKLANKLIGVPLSDKERLETFSIFVDFSENHPEGRLKGYFMNKFTILRFLPIEFDYALLFPVHNHGWGEFKEAHGITYSELKEAFSDRKTVRIVFRAIPMIQDKILYSVDFWTSKKMTFGPLEKRLDDIGMPYIEFKDIDSLSLIEIPNEICLKQYTLVGKEHYTPYATDNDCDCILFAQLDNEYDGNAIKILRWFPAKKGIEVDQLLGMAEDGGDIFFEMGYISRFENSELHNFMVENSSRLLFGKAKDGKVIVTGGIKDFLHNDLKYPRCLYNIKILK